MRHKSPSVGTGEIFKSHILFRLALLFPEAKRMSSVGAEH